MLIGFIVVIVMILVIVGLMATGNSGGGTGVNQTKATKVVTEIGTLAQSISFFKTTTTAGDYVGLDSAKAIALLDGYTTVTVDETAIGQDVEGNGDTTNAAVDAIVSQAESTLNYTFSVNSADTKELDIHVVLTGSDKNLNQAIGETISSKLASGNMTVDDAGVASAGTYTTNDVLTVQVK